MYSNSYCRGRIIIKNMPQNREKKRNIRQVADIHPQQPSFIYPIMRRNIPFFYTLYNVITMQYIQMVQSFQPCLKATNTCSNTRVITSSSTTRATRKTLTSTSCINNSPQEYNYPPEEQQEEEDSRRHNHLHEYFPVLSKIAGINWKGNCTYVDTNLSPISNLKLRGGVRFDVNATAGTVQMSSFTEFPNGKVREIIMKGQKSTTNSSGSVLDLYPVGTTNGPIYMKITELLPDTILFHELERSTDKMILTGSLSIVQVLEGEGGRRDGVGVTRTELVQISHELAGGGTNDCTIQGHQVWRYIYIISHD